MSEDGFGDWRIHSVLTLGEDIPPAYPGGPSHKAGSPIYLKTSTTRTGNQPVGFTTPSSTALALNIAMAASLQTQDLYKYIVFGDVITPEGKGKSVLPQNTTPLYNYFEQCMIAITFSFLALETFCNWEISVTDKFSEPFKIKRNKDEESFTVDQLERALSTEEKLHWILPKIFDIASPKGRGVWSNYKKLKRSRDSIVHIKSKDQYPNRGADKLVDESSLYFVFLNQDIRFFPKAAVEMILYFHSNEEEIPRWLKVPKEFAKQK